MCNSNQECLDSYDYYAADGEFYEDEDYSEVNEEYSDSDSDRGYVSGGSDGLNHVTTSASSNYLAYMIIGGVLTAFILAIVWRKRVSRPWDEG
jgi:hypothetical protein